jgi:hypothetical protein
LPPEITDIIMCQEMGWAWHELMATPPEVVDDVRAYLQKRALIARERGEMMDKR